MRLAKCAYVCACVRERVCLYVCVYACVSVWYTVCTHAYDIIMCMHHVYDLYTMGRSGSERCMWACGLVNWYIYRRALVTYSAIVFGINNKNNNNYYLLLISYILLIIIYYYSKFSSTCIVVFLLEREPQTDIEEMSPCAEGCNIWHIKLTFSTTNIVMR